MGRTLSLGSLGAMPVGALTIGVNDLDTIDPNPVWRKCDGSAISKALYPAASFLARSVIPDATPTAITFPAGFTPYATSGSQQAEFSARIGAYWAVCGRSATGPALAYSADLVNWTVATINTANGGAEQCIVACKIGATYYAMTYWPANGVTYIYSSADLAAWALVFTQGGVGGDISGTSTVAVSGAGAAIIQGGVGGTFHFDGAAWSFALAGPGSNHVLLTVLATGEIAAVESNKSIVGPVAVYKKAPTATSWITSTLTSAGTASMSTGTIHGWNSRIVHFNNKYLVCIAGAVYSSPDFVTWTALGDKGFLAFDAVDGVLYGLARVGGVTKFYSSIDGAAFSAYYTSQRDMGLPVSSSVVGGVAKITPMANGNWALCNARTSSNYDAFYAVSIIYSPTTSSPSVINAKTASAPDRFLTAHYELTPSGNGVFLGRQYVVSTFDAAANWIMPIYAANPAGSNAVHPNSYFLKVRE